MNIGDTVQKTGGQAFRRDGAMTATITRIGRADFVQLSNGVSIRRRHLVVVPPAEPARRGAQIQAPEGFEHVREALNEAAIPVVDRFVVEMEEPVPVAEAPAAVPFVVGQEVVYTGEGIGMNWVLREPTPLVIGARIVISYVSFATGSIRWEGGEYLHTQEWFTAVPREFQVGDVVMIREDSPYYVPGDLTNPMDTEGTIGDGEGDMDTHNLTVHWPNGTNVYRKADLKFADGTTPVAAIPAVDPDAFPARTYKPKHRSLKFGGHVFKLSQDELKALEETVSLLIEDD